MLSKHHGSGVRSLSYFETPVFVLNYFFLFRKMYVSFASDVITYYCIKAPSLPSGNLDDFLFILVLKVEQRIMFIPDD